MRMRNHLFNQNKRKVQYIRVSANELGKLQPVTETQIAQYYQENKAQFISQKLAHIQLATEKEAECGLSRTAKRR